MKTCDRFRTAVWILLFGSNAVLTGVFSFTTVGGVLILFASVPTFPRCITALRFWLVVAAPVVIGFAAPAVPLTDGFVFAGKAFVFLLLVEFLRRRISPRKIELLFRKAGLGGLGFAFTVALNSLASVGEKVRVVWYTVRMRGGFRGTPFKGLKIFIEAVLFTVLAQGEQIYLAALSKGYGDNTFAAHPERES
ncbi:MAG: hypothetical protein ACOCX6_01120 [bacterium]